MSFFSNHLLHATNELMKKDLRPEGQEEKPKIGPGGQSPITKSSKLQPARRRSFNTHCSAVRL